MYGKEVEEIVALRLKILVREKFLGKATMEYIEHVKLMKT
jgi:hypothetical protein